MTQVAAMPRLDVGPFESSTNQQELTVSTSIHPSIHPSSFYYWNYSDELSSELTQKILDSGKVASLISSQQWPLYSPDLNPMDFSIWSVLEVKVSTKKISDGQRFRDCSSQNTIRPHSWSVWSLPDRFDVIIRAKGDYNEQ